MTPEDEAAILQRPYFIAALQRMTNNELSALRAACEAAASTYTGSHFASDEENLLRVFIEPVYERLRDLCRKERELHELRQALRTLGIGR